MKISIIYYTYKVNIKTILLEEYVNFVDNTKKQNNYFKVFLFLVTIIMFLFLFFFISIFKMDSSFSLQQISRTGNLDSNLISRQYKLNLVADFMRIKYENPKMKQSEKANQLCYSTSTLQRYRNDINMLSPYKIQSNNSNEQRKKTPNSNSNNNIHRDPDLKGPQMTSNDLKRPQSASNENSKK